tara:strand:- start:732 stop:989 length:258 start_codon:yes stop_codon:yes gene_type:complete
MARKKIQVTKDPIVTSLMNQMAERSNAGISKYKNTMATTRMDKIKALENAIEELLDGAVYLKKAVVELKQEEEEEFKNFSYGGTI